MVFQEAISTMDTGEYSEFVIPWQKLYGAQGLPGNVPQCANLTFNIHLLNPQEQHVIKQTSNNIVKTITDREIVEEDNEAPISEEGYQVVYTKLTIELVKTYSTETVKKVHFGPDKEKEKKSTGNEHSPIRAKQVRTSEEHDGPLAEKNTLSEGNTDERVINIIIDNLEDEEKEEKHMKQEETAEEHSPGKIQQAVQTFGEHNKSI